MRLRSGVRLESAVCEAQAVVIKAPDGVDIDVRCGGEPMHEVGGTSGVRSSAHSSGEGAQLGKRYAHEELGLELLCTRGGTGTLAVGESALRMKGSKPLPASD